MRNCKFCKIIQEGKTKEDTIFEDEKVIVMLDKDWAVKGHTLVVWKEHFENASNLPIKDFLYFSKIFYQTEKALLETLNLNRSIVLRSGSLISHFHFHIYPIKSNTSWKAIKDIFDKKQIYKHSLKEKKDLITNLKKYF